MLLLRRRRDASLGQPSGTVGTFAITGVLRSSREVRDDSFAR